eukprot:11743377-Karenia_brevis.AAC.2
MFNVVCFFGRMPAGRPTKANSPDFMYGLFVHTPHMWVVFTTSQQPSSCYLTSAKLSLADGSSIA